MVSSHDSLPWVDWIWPRFSGPMNSLCFKRRIGWFLKIRDWFCLVVWGFFRAILSPKSLGMLLVILAPVFHFRWQQYVGELTPIIYCHSLNVRGDFCLWADEIKMALCISAVLASSSLYVRLSPKSLWHTQAVVVSSVERQSFSFLLAMNFLMCVQLPVLRMDYFAVLQS